jgi:hypothetical protein
MGRKRKPSRREKESAARPKLARREFVWWIKNIALAIIAMIAYDGLKLWWNAPSHESGQKPEELVAAHRLKAEPGEYRMTAADGLSIRVHDTVSMTESLIMRVANATQTNARANPKL